MKPFDIYPPKPARTEEEKKQSDKAASLLWKMVNERMKTGTLSQQSYNELYEFMEEYRASMPEEQ